MASVSAARRIPDAKLRLLLLWILNEGTVARVENAATVHDGDEESATAAAANADATFLPMIIAANDWRNYE